MHTKVGLRITRYINDDIKLATLIITTIFPKARDQILDALVLMQRIYIAMFRRQADISRGARSPLEHASLLVRPGRHFRNVVRENDMAPETKSQKA